MDVAVVLMIPIRGNAICFIIAIHVPAQRVIPIGLRLRRVLISFDGIRVRLGQHVGGRRDLGHSRNVETRDAGGVFSAKLSFAGAKLMSTES